MGLRLGRRGALALLAVLLAALSARAADPAGNPDAEKAAGGAAEAWLAIVDAGQYGESWDAGAALFKSALTREQWIQALDRVRKPLGKPLSRKLRGATYRTQVTGAPPGEYVVLQYDTQFENLKGATETITPMREKSGAWRVSGYYIR
ncbi:MAG TPA: DUF4019 domain-containing protein [Thermoanaerobaculia bacterium]|nr:DUF4019 domain-containing protein [Thermoanaerobaculia bacterium]